MKVENVGLLRIVTFEFKKISQFIENQSNKYFFIVSIVELERFSMGKHLLLEVYNVKYNLINDAIALEKVMVVGIQRAGMTILNIFRHCFTPQGCTIVIALSESHVSCHTWPEEGSIAIDVYTCGEGNPKLIALELLKYLNSDDYSIREIDR
jgi:S-adenosylmethionine decarboxylase